MSDRYYCYIRVLQWCSSLSVVGQTSRFRVQIVLISVFVRFVNLDRS